MSKELTREEVIAELVKAPSIPREELLGIGDPFYYKPTNMSNKNKQTFKQPAEVVPNTDPLPDSTKVLDPADVPSVEKFIKETEGNHPIVQDERKDTPLLVSLTNEEMAKQAAALEIESKKKTIVLTPEELEKKRQAEEVKTLANFFNR